MLTFRAFLEEHQPDSNREKVGLAVYYLQTYGEEDYVTSSDIRDLFNINKVSMSRSTIAAHLHNLEDDGLVLEHETQWDKGYMLSPDGVKRFERVAGERLESPPPEELSGEDLRDHYENLYDEAQRILEELQEVKESSRKWRRRSWAWRIGSFIAGAGIGVLGSLLI